LKVGEILKLRRYHAGELRITNVKNLKSWKISKFIRCDILEILKGEVEMNQFFKGTDELWNIKVWEIMATKIKMSQMP
jgi:hypothetical protein